VKPTHLELIRHFDEFSDDMLVPDPVAMIMLNVSPRQWRRERPVPKRQLGERLGGCRVGDIRKVARGEKLPAA